MKHIQAPSYITRPNKMFMAAALLAVSASTFADTKVEKCTTNLGTIAVHEPNGGYAHLSSYGLGSPTALLRLMIQQSGCFDVVERGAAMSNLQQERALGASGELQQDSNVGKGQMQAADFVLTANVQATGNTGGVGGAIAGVGKLFGSVGAAIGAVAGGLKFKEANTSILIADVRSSIQVAAAEGKAKKTDFSIGGWGYGAGTFGAGGGYTKTPEGKMIAASLVDNYNQIVLQIRDKPQLIKQRSESSAANAANSIKATGTSNVPPPPPQQVPTPAPTNYAATKKPVAVAPVAEPPSPPATIPLALVGEYSCMMSGALIGHFTLDANNQGSVAGGGLLSGSTRAALFSGELNAQGELTSVFVGNSHGGNITGKVDAAKKLKGTYKLHNSKTESGDTGNIDCKKL